MKVTTTLRDNGKVNQIVPIMQEHLGSVMNLARIKLLACSSGTLRCADSQSPQDSICNAYVCGA